MKILYSPKNHNFGRGPPKEHSNKVSLKLAERFQRRRSKYEMLTDNGGRTPSDEKSSHGLLGQVS